MATFQVPQFIEQKAKIIGALTIMQFGYIAVGGLLIYGLFYVFNLFVWILATIPISGIVVFLAFARINGQPSHKILGSVFSYIMGSKTYVWQRKANEESIKILDEDKVKKMRKDMSVQEKIKSIALSVTTGKIFNDKTHKSGDNKKTNDKFEVATFTTGEKKLVKRIDY